MVYYWFNHMIPISSICFWGSLTHDPMEVASATPVQRSQQVLPESESLKTHHDTVALSKQTQQWKVLRLEILEVQKINRQIICIIMNLAEVFFPSPHVCFCICNCQIDVYYIYVYIYTLHTRSCYVGRSKYPLLSVNIIHVCTCILLVQSPGLPIRYTPSKCIAACSPFQNHG